MNTNNKTNIFMKAENETKRFLKENHTSEEADKFIIDRLFFFSESMSAFNAMLRNFKITDKVIYIVNKASICGFYPNGCVDWNIVFETQQTVSEDIIRSVCGNFVKTEWESLIRGHRFSEKFIIDFNKKYKCTELIAHQELPEAIVRRFWGIKNHKTREIRNMLMKYQVIPEDIIRDDIDYIVEYLSDEVLQYQNMSQDIENEVVSKIIQKYIMKENK